MANPLCYWPFSEGTGTVVDETMGHSAYDFLLTGGTWTTGQQGAALANSGAGSAADFGGAILDLGSVYSIGVWIRNWDGSNDGVILAGVSGHYAWYLDATDAYHSASGGNFVTVPHGGGLSGSSWRHLAVVRNGATVQFYKNGTPLGAAQTLGAGGTALQLRALGGYSDGTFGFAADVDDLRIYDVALSAAEVRALVSRFPPLLLAV